MIVGKLLAQKDANFGFDACRAAKYVDI